MEEIGKSLCQAVHFKMAAAANKDEGDALFKVLRLLSLFCKLFRLICLVLYFDNHTLVSCIYHIQST